MQDPASLTAGPEVDSARGLLVAGRKALQTGQLLEAAEAFGAAASGFTGPTSLLGGGLAWRGLAEVAMTQSRWSDAVAALDQAERLFEVARGQGEAVGRPKAMRDALQACLAACRLARGDVFLRQGELELARRLLNESVHQYSGLEGPQTELWRMLARLAEHETRWNAGRMAWRRVERGCRALGDSAGEADAAIRRTEVLLMLGRMESAADTLKSAELAARTSMDATLLGRVRMATASMAEHRSDYTVAFKCWQGALEALEHADPNLRGLACVRMALVAAEVRPLEVAFLLTDGLRLLLEVPHPDALGLVHHQLARAALVLGKPGVAVLAAAGAERARGRGHPHTQAVLIEAFDLLPAPMAFDDLVRSEGLMERDLGGRRGAIHLCDRLMERPVLPMKALTQRSSSPRLIWKEEGELREAEVPAGLVTLGSFAEADIRLPADESVRFSMRSDDAGVRIQVDPASALPVLLDGHPVRGEHFLTDGDVLTLGDLEITHVVPPPKRSLPSLPPRHREPSVVVAPTPVPALELEPARGRAAYGFLFVVAVGAASAGFGIAAGAMLVLLALGSMG